MTSMSVEHGAHGASRIAGRGALLYSLERFRRRVARFAEHRAVTAHERLWAALLLDQIDQALKDGIAAAGAQASLQAYTLRRHRSQKTPRKGTSA